MLSFPFCMGRLPCPDILFVGIITRMCGVCQALIFSKILPEKTIFCIRTANCFGSLFGKVRHNSQLIPNLRSAIQQYSQICRNVEKFQVKKRKKLAKNRKKGLTFREVFAIIYEQRRESEEPSRREHGGIAQLARAFGSYPTGRWFKSDFRYQSFYDW